MFLIDTNVISEVRKSESANAGVRRFFKDAQDSSKSLFISVVTVGELRRGVESVRHRGDLQQANLLENWLIKILSEYSNFVLDFDTDVAQLWGRLRVPHYENAIDKQIAATALIHGLTVVTRNDRDFAKLGVPVINPFV